MDERYLANYTRVKGNCGSNFSDRGKRKMAADCEEVQLLRKRMQVLEVEASAMRKQMLACTEERREIVTDILRVLRTVQSAQHSSGSDSTHSFPLSQERRYHSVGLLQALCEDSHPGELVVLSKSHPGQIRLLDN